MMVQLFHNTAVQVTSAPTIFPILTGLARGTIRSNVTIANNAAGASSTINVTYLSQSEGALEDSVPPGTVLSAQDVAVDDLQLSSSGGNAVVAVDLRWPGVLPPNNLTVTGTVNAAISGTVKTDLGQGTGVRDIANLTQATQLPASLTGGGQLAVGVEADGVGLAKAAQLPTALDAGNLKVAIEKPLTTASSVAVHDVGS